MLYTVNFEVSMTRKYHNHTLQTDPKHREEEPQMAQITNRHKTSGRATSSPFLIEMVAKLERSLHIDHYQPAFRYWYMYLLHRPTAYNPLCTDGFFLLVGCNKIGMVH